LSEKFWGGMNERKQNAREKLIITTKIIATTRYILENSNREKIVNRYISSLTKRSKAIQPIGPNQVILHCSCPDTLQCSITILLKDFITCNPWALKPWDTKTMSQSDAMNPKELPHHNTGRKSLRTEIPKPCSQNHHYSPNNFDSFIKSSLT
jgi:hypothetical protein